MSKFYFSQKIHMAALVSAAHESGDANDWPKTWIQQMDVPPSSALQQSVGAAVQPRDDIIPERISSMHVYHAAAEIWCALAYETQ